jgi:hypothetical protein
MDPLSESRASLKNALHKGDFNRAREKIVDNLNLINSNIKELQDYVFKIGSKKENKALMDKVYF